MRMLFCSFFLNVDKKKKKKKSRGESVLGVKHGNKDTECLSIQNTMKRMAPK